MNFGEGPYVEIGESEDPMSAKRYRPTNAGATPATASARPVPTALEGELDLIRSHSISLDLTRSRPS